MTDSTELWNAYITRLTTMEDGSESPIKHAAIWTHTLGWHTESKELKDILEKKDLEVLNGDRSGLSGTGMTIGGEKCIFLSDALDVDQDHMLKMKTRVSNNSEQCFVCIGKTCSVYIVVKGIPSATGGQVTEKLYDTIKILRERGF